MGPLLHAESGLDWGSRADLLASQRRLSYVPPFITYDNTLILALAALFIMVRDPSRGFHVSRPITSSDGAVLPPLPIMLDPPFSRQSRYIYHRLPNRSQALLLGYGLRHHGRDPSSRPQSQNSSDYVIISMQVFVTCHKRELLRLKACQCWKPPAFDKLDLVVFSKPCYQCVGGKTQVFVLDIHTSGPSNRATYLSSLHPA